MRTEHHVHLTFFCLTDRDCAKIPYDLDFRNEYNIYNITDFTTPFPFPKWPERFIQADYTYTLTPLYAGFNTAWAVTCVIVIGKWKERAVEDSR
jgi:hypothetical protein